MNLKSKELALSILLAFVVTAPVQATDSPFSKLSEQQQLSEDMLREIVGFETTSERPDETRKSLEAMIARLKDAGFPSEDIELVNPGDGQYGLVVRYRGLGNEKPLLLLAHMDVVTATPDAWAFPPFSLGKKDGYYVGRGTSDNKAGVVQILSNFIRLKEEGWVPGRDLIAAISGDEETDGAVAKWLANEGRALIDAQYAINSDAGGGEYDESGQHKAFWIQTSEKLYQTYVLTASNEGGHSSLPRPENAIQDLALAITRLAEYEFPVIISDSTRMRLERSAANYPDELSRDMLALVEEASDIEAARRLSAADPYFNATLRTTCTPTMLNGGHAENALPRDASVTVNCRIMPGTPAIEIERKIASLIDGLEIEITIIYEGIPSDPSNMPAAFLEGNEAMVEARWGEIPVIPNMSPGATDGLFYRNAGIPVYGVGAAFSKPDDMRAHGLDERLGIFEFHESVDYWYEMLKTFAD
jgi:acetylornithine deacetylase/succinyl-diaminopimelate desuccinylase-like protein